MPDLPSTEDQMRQTVTLLRLPEIEVQLLVPVKAPVEEEESGVKPSIEIEA
jgi:hypothetical protein